VIVEPSVDVEVAVDVDIEAPSIAAELEASALSVQTRLDIRGKEISWILTKQGGGTSFFGSRSWKERFFVLRDTWLMYFTDPQAKARGDVCLGAFDLAGCRVVDLEEFGSFCVRLELKPGAGIFGRKLDRQAGLVIKCGSEEMYRSFVPEVISRAAAVVTVNVPQVMIEEGMGKATFELGQSIVKEEIVVVEIELPIAELDAMTLAEVTEVVAAAEAGALALRESVEARRLEIDTLSGELEKVNASAILATDSEDLQAKDAEAKALRDYLATRRASEA